MSRGWAPTAPPTLSRKRLPGRCTGDGSPSRPWDRARRWLVHHAADPMDPPAELVAEAVRQHRPALSAGQTAGEMQQLTDHLTGLGPLAGPARQPGVTDLLVDGSGTVWTDGAAGLRPTGLRLDVGEAHRLAVRLLTQGGRRLDAGQPYADAQVAGARVHAVLPPVSDGGVQLSIRLPPATVSGLDEISAHWPCRTDWLGLLRHLVGVRATVLVSGATGSGKTTLLAAVLSEVAPDERIITVEDTRELRPDHPHVVALQARAANAEGAGSVSLADLVRQALRMRPDRLVVGECRGAEVADFLAAMNTGHRGAWGTLHANSAQDVPARLLAMGALAGLTPGAVAVQAGAAVDAVLHVERTPAGRHPVQLAVVHRADPVATEPSWRLVPALSLRDGALHRGAGLDRLEAWSADRAPLLADEPARGRHAARG